MLTAIRKEMPALLHLALPIIAGQLGQMLLGIADTAMVGWTGVVPLAACSLANAVLAIPAITGLGLLFGVAVRTSAAHGAGASHEAGEVLRHGCLLALIAGLALGLMATFGAPLLGHLGQSPEVAETARVYFIICGWSMIPAFVFTVFRQYCEALGAQWPAFWILLGSVLLNVLLNWIFIFGHWGSPVMGIEGAGWATLISRVIAMLVLFWYVQKALRFTRQRPVRWIAPLHPQEIRGLVKIGLPSAGQLLFEAGAFSFAAILLGWISKEALAAHHVALSCAAFTFMVPLGLSMASTIRIGSALGACQPERFRPIAFGAWIAGLAFMGCTALGFIFFGETVARWFVDDAVVIALTAKLLVIAGIFQLLDSQQVNAMGALRGLHDVRVPMGIVFAAYWLVALPVGASLAFRTSLGPIGMWVGLACGLGCAALLLTLRFLKKTRTEG